MNTAQALRDGKRKVCQRFAHSATAVHAFAGPPLRRLRNEHFVICSTDHEHHTPSCGTPRTRGVPLVGSTPDTPCGHMCSTCVAAIAFPAIRYRGISCTLPHPCVHERYKFVRDVHKKARSFHSGRVVFLSADRHDLRQRDQQRHPRRIHHRPRRHHRRPPPSPSAAAA